MRVYVIHFLLDLNLPETSNLKLIEPKYCTTQWKEQLYANSLEHTMQIMQLNENLENFQSEEN